LGKPAIFTREPSIGPIGYMIRMALTGRLKGKRENGTANGAGADEDLHMATELDPLVMALLFAADRRDHIAVEVAPNLARGRTVFCDRYLMSTLAYQGLHTDLDWLLAINEKAIQPDLTIFLDINADVARQRIQGTRWTEDIYEGIETQSRVREMYHHVIDMGLPILGPVVRVDSSLPKQVVQAKMRQIVSHFLETGIMMTEHQPNLGLFG
jgi:dTMP kinase